MPFTCLSPGIPCEYQCGLGETNLVISLVLKYTNGNSFPPFIGVVDLPQCMYTWISHKNKTSPVDCLQNIITQHNCLDSLHQRQYNVDR